jgi:hypothetical protein
MERAPLQDELLWSTIKAIKTEFRKIAAPEDRATFQGHITIWYVTNNQRCARLSSVRMPSMNVPSSPPARKN